jgi:hypothetical protein
MGLGSSWSLVLVLVLGLLVFGLGVGSFGDGSWGLVPVLSCLLSLDLLLPLVPLVCLFLPYCPHSPCHLAFGYWLLAVGTWLSFAFVSCLLALLRYCLSAPSSRFPPPHMHVIKNGEALAIFSFIPSCFWLVLALSWVLDLGLRSWSWVSVLGLGLGSWSWVSGPVF